VQWLTQGNPHTPPLSWAAHHSYTLDARIIDSKGNIEVATTVTGNSGATVPNWATTPGVTTGPDGGVTWTNAGAVFTNAYAAHGGASAIILDNTVLSGTLPGASQIYFSTLSDQLCGDGTTGSCAVQASQPALK
jgi:hypothetical protein